MDKAVLIGVIFLLSALGAGVYWFEYGAQAVDATVQVYQEVSDQEVVLEWENPSFDMQEIQIYQSTHETLPGSLIYTVEDPIQETPLSVKVQTYGVGIPSFYTVVALKNNGSKHVIGQAKIVPRSQYDTLVVSSRNDEGVSEVREFDVDGTMIRSFVPFEEFRGELDVVRIKTEIGVLFVVVQRTQGGQIALVSEQGEVIFTRAPYGDAFRHGLSLTTIRLSHFDQHIALGPRWMSDGTEGSFPVKVYRYTPDDDATLYEEHSFIAYTSFNGGVELTAGDVDGDGLQELITTPRGGLAEVRIHHLCTTTKGDCAVHYGTQALTQPWSVYDKIFPYGRIETQDIFVRAIDINDDGKDELLVAPHAGRTAIIKLYECTIEQGYRCLAKEITAHQAYHDAYTGGVHMVVGYTPQPYLVVAPQVGGGPHVKTYRVGKTFHQAHEQFVYAPQFTGGVDLATIYHEGSMFFATTPFTRGGPHVRLFEMLSGGLYNQFFAFNQTLRNGLHIH